jgi:glycosyltransferase involved in cell wall biosynthesis
MKDTVIPSKLLMYMAAGKPVLAAVNAGSQAAFLLNQAQGGILVAPDDPAALAAAVVNLKRQRAELIQMGARNRAYAEVWFDERKVFEAQTAFLHDITSHPSRILPRTSLGRV